MSRYNYGWSHYVSVAERRAKASKKMEQLRKKGVDIQPVVIEGRLIAKSFWGKAWCAHLDSFGDYSNRLPRGRTYVRNGSVCHLDVGKGKVEAIVSGSSLYTVTMSIQTLTRSKWEVVKNRCKGGIGSLLELLQGRLSDEIMGVVTDRNDGLFPGPREIQYQCTCPDYAGMCKHIAAVVYGIGARLDSRPELLFILRGVDHEELIDADAAVSAAIATDGQGTSRRRRLATGSLDDVFGVEFDGTAESVRRKPTTTKTTHKAKKAAVKAVKPKAAKAVKTAAKQSAKESARPFKATPASIRKLRGNLSLSRQAFANKLGVSAQSVMNWETKTGPLKLQPSKLAALQALARQSR
jgi:uncharacterized Zn finger protein